MSRLKDMYKDEIVDAMIKKFGYKNIMEVPKIDKIVLNMGVGEAKDNAKVLESAVLLNLLWIIVRIAVKMLLLHRLVLAEKSLCL